VVDPKTVKITVKQPDATLVAQLSDRAGMMLAPKASSGDVGSKPVCAGPFKFVQRVQQDRIVLERFDQYWNKQAIHFDKVIFQPIPDTSVRLANLRAGDLDMIERVAPTDVKIAKADPGLAVYSNPGLGYVQLSPNIANGVRAQTPIGRDSRVRKAFELSIDRDALNQVIFEGLYTPANQPFPPSSVYHDAKFPMPGRDVAKAQALLAQAGVKTPLDVDLMVPNNTIGQQVGQIVQAMAGEAGFNVRLLATEFATLISHMQAGDFEIALDAWSGRPDPDGNIHQYVTCKGSQNDGHYCNPKLDDILNRARAVSDQGQRQALYDEALGVLESELPEIYLYFDPRIIAARKKVTGFVPNPDGLIRFPNLAFSP
jgi:peptide/nickel transport system substrate-binding protein